MKYEEILVNGKGTFTGALIFSRYLLRPAIVNRIY